MYLSVAAIWRVSIAGLKSEAFYGKLRWRESLKISIEEWEIGDASILVTLGWSTINQKGLFWTGSCNASLVAAASYAWETFQIGWPFQMISLEISTPSSLKSFLGINDWLLINIGDDFRCDLLDKPHDCVFEACNFTLFYIPSLWWRRDRCWMRLIEPIFISEIILMRDRSGRCYCHSLEQFHHFDFVIITNIVSENDYRNRTKL